MSCPVFIGVCCRILELPSEFPDASEWPSPGRPVGRPVAGVRGPAGGAVLHKPPLPEGAAQPRRPAQAPPLQAQPEGPCFHGNLHDAVVASALRRAGLRRAQPPAAEEGQHRRRPPPEDPGPIPDLRGGGGPDTPRPAASTDPSPVLHLPTTLRSVATHQTPKLLVL